MLAWVHVQTAHDPGDTALSKSLSVYVQYGRVRDETLMAAATLNSAQGGLPFHPALQDPNTLQIGAARIHSAAVAAYEIEQRDERDWDGQWLCAIAYGFGATLLLIGILLGMDWKFAIAVTFLAAISAMSVIDAAGVRPVTTYWVHLVLHDGRRVSFVDADLRVVTEIARRIERARTCPS